MKKDIIILSILSLFLFASCYTDLELLPVLEEKTTIKTFSHLEEPIVFQVPAGEVYENKITEKKDKIRISGKVFVVYDWKTDKIFDWIYCEGQKNWMVKPGLFTFKNSGRYYYGELNNTKLYWIDATDTKINSVDVEVNDGFDYHDSVGNYSISYYPDYEIFYIFDDRIQTFKYVTKPNINFKIDASFCDENNTLWISSHTTTGKVEICKMEMDSENQAAQKLFEFNMENEGFYYLEHADSNYLFITHRKKTNEPLMDPQLFVYDVHSAELTEIQMDSVKNIKHFNQGSFTDVIKVKDEYYAVNAVSWIEEKYPCNMQIYKINLNKDDLSKTYLELVSPEEFTFNHSLEVEVRGSKIYFINSVDNAINLQFVYFDTETKTFCTPFTIKYKDIVRQY